MSRTQNSKKNVFCPEKNILDLSIRMFFYLHAKYISNLIGFKEKKVLRLFDTLGYIFMFETHNSEKKHVFCSKNVIFDFFQTFFSKRLNCIMRSIKKCCSICSKSRRRTFNPWFQLQRPERLFLRRKNEVIEIKVVGNSNTSMLNKFRSKVVFTKKY